MTTAFEQGQVPPIEIRHRLRIAREYAGYDTSTLAELVAVSRNTITNAESGRVSPRRIMVNAWALATGVPVSWLLTGQAPPAPDGPGYGLGIISGKASAA
jgi:transcriptional regulator with XRE-family HTH domain